MSESSTDDQLAAALDALQAAEPTRAEAIYRDLLAQGCRDVRLFSNLGALALQRSDAAGALPWLEQGVAVDPQHARCLLNLGMAQQQLGRTPQAIAAIRRSLEADPTLPEAWNNLAVALTEDDTAHVASTAGGGPPPGRAEAIAEVLAAYRRALELHPGYGQAAANLARLLAEIGDPQAGEAVLGALPPEACGGEELFALAEMLRLQGRIPEACARYGECLAREPANSQLRLGVGVALLVSGQADQALLEMLPLIASRPDDTAPLVGVGAALQAMGETDQAMDMLKRALVLDPDQIRARNLLGLCHNERGEHSLAIEQFRAGLQVAPDDRQLRCNLAGALRHQGDLGAAIREMEQLLHEQPECQEACLIQLFSCSIGSERLAPLGLKTAARYWELLRRQPQQGAALRPAADLAPLQPGWSSAGTGSPAQAPEPLRIAAADRRLRIGFLSAEIGDHVVGSFLSTFLDHYDRSRFAVELFMASRRFDATAERMAARADQHWLLSGMAPAPARSLIRSRQLDVLVETSGFTRDSGIELLHQRCAPVQCHYIGFHASTGLDTIDWFIGDQETVPECFAPQFVERLWRLPRPWLARRPDPGLPPAQSSAGDSRPVLGSFNQLSKVREETLEHWLAALQAVPAAQVLIKDRSVVDPVVRERITAFLGRGGVERERIRFLPPTGSWEEHMALYNAIDVALDATPWSSASTGFDALSMGVPLVAIRGGCTAARMSAAILLGIGRGEWIADSPARFAAVVAGLCRDLESLRQGKHSLRQQVLASPLFDGADLARALGEAFVAMRAEARKRGLV
ncbi:MAG: tetratricopeptide repeat protein [Cyanobacteriota bacterium]